MDMYVYMYGYFYIYIHISMYATLDIFVCNVLSKTACVT